MIYRVTASGTLSDNKWYNEDSEWYNEWQRVLTKVRNELKPSKMI